MAEKLLQVFLPLNLVIDAISRFHDPRAFTCELTVVVGACRVLLVGAERRAGGRTGAKAGVAQGRAHLAGLTAVVDWPLDVQGGGERGALLGLDARRGE